MSKIYLFRNDSSDLNKMYVFCTSALVSAYAVFCRYNAPQSCKAVVDIFYRDEKSFHTNVYRDVYC